MMMYIKGSANATRGAKKTIINYRTVHYVFPVPPLYKVERRTGGEFM
jgi:hypothetical protein